MKNNTFTNIIDWTGDIIGAIIGATITLAAISTVVFAAVFYTMIGMIHLVAFMIYG